ncbi:hypothetical protein COL516b_011978 [Colletotrichum fioriniae]|nr:uncharacterized protein COL516b_011978 [Colletotrichum fioriniae]KAJ0296018.1 hypothetical protein COL516b_011978 [Colletotrichum fioriniae]
MHASAILVTLLAATGMAAPSPAITNDGASQFIARQDPRLKQAQDRLQGARTASMETGAVTAAVGEIAVYGVAAIGLAAVSGLLGVFLDVVGFAGCEAAAIGELNKAEAECQTLVG